MDSFAAYPKESFAIRQALDVMQSIRARAHQYEPHLLVAPDDTRLVVAPYASFEQRLIAKPGSYLWAIAASTDQSAGFLLQISDYSTRTNLFKSDTRSFQASSVSTKDALGQAMTFGQPLHFLAKPRLILKPGTLGVKLTNLSGTTGAKIQVVLYMASPI